MSLEEVLPSEEVLWCVMEHVLRIQVGKTTFKLYTELLLPIEKHILL